MSLTLDQLKESLEAVITYNWNDELRDYEEQQRLGEDVSQHIFTHLRQLEEFVSGVPMVDEAEVQREMSLHLADASIEHEKWRQHDG